jgi:serine/threonine-protein kinase HipA
MTGRQRSVLVYVDVHGAGGPARMGTLHAQSSGRQEVFSFECAPEWLVSEAVFAFDPDLQLLEGAQYPAQSRSNFGIFLDSAPDRWGRLLMQRRENLRARQEERPARRLTEWDYLLGVRDETRLGIIAEVEAAVKSWRDQAEALRIRRSEQDQMAAAFAA